MVYCNTLVEGGALFNLTSRVSSVCSGSDDGHLRYRFVQVLAAPMLNERAYRVKKKSQLHHKLENGRNVENKLHKKLHCKLHPSFFVEYVYMFTVCLCFIDAYLNSGVQYLSR